MHSQQQGKLHLYVHGTLDRCSELVSYASVEEDGTSGLVTEVFDDLMTRIGLVLMFYFFMVAHKAACQTLSRSS